MNDWTCRTSEKPITWDCYAAFGKVVFETSEGTKLMMPADSAREMAGLLLKRAMELEAEESA